VGIFGLKFTIWIIIAQIIKVYNSFLLLETKIWVPRSGLVIAIHGRNQLIDLKNSYFGKQFHPVSGK